jgi:hypothetical protein
MLLGARGTPATPLAAGDEAADGKEGRGPGGRCGMWRGREGNRNGKQSKLRPGGLGSMPVCHI